MELAKQGLAKAIAEQRITLVRMDALSHAETLAKIKKFSAANFAASGGQSIRLV